MDSDDDFMSDITSQLDEDMDFIDTQGSDDESLGEGKPDFMLIYGDDGLARSAWAADGCLYG